LLGELRAAEREPALKSRLFEPARGRRVTREVRGGARVKFLLFVGGRRFFFGGECARVDE
jgi:hypothetical protein